MAQLLERAKAALAAGPAPAGTLKDLEKLLDAGELDQASRILQGLLRQAPDDPELKARFGRLCLALAQIPFVVNFFWSAVKGRRSGDNPWEATTLERMSRPPR